MIDFINKIDETEDFSDGNALLLLDKMEQKELFNRTTLSKKANFKDLLTDGSITITTHAVVEKNGALKVVLAVYSDNPDHDLGKEDVLITESEYNMLKREIEKIVEAQDADIEISGFDFADAEIYNNSKTVDFTVFCQAYYKASFGVPAHMNKEEAMEYVRDHLHEIPITELEYLPESDELDEEDFDFEEDLV